MEELSLVLISALVLAQAAAHTSKTGRDVVVTARPLASTETAWRDCVARGCPPDEEIAAALAHAENQFVAGDYEAADRTLGRTTGRLGGRGRAHPVAVGDLWRARSRIKEHRGQREFARYAAFRSLEALRDGLGRDDRRALVQQIELGDMLAKTGHPEAALDTYAAAAERAGAAGLWTARGYALLSGAVLLTAYAEVEPAMTERARRAVRRVQATSEAELAPYREAAAVLQAMLDARSGDAAAVDRALAGLSARAGGRPVLIHSPPMPRDLMEPVGAARLSGGSARTAGPDDHWMDFGFWVRPDGTVSQAQLLRSNGKPRRRWVDAVLAQARSRRYAPLAMPSDSPGAFRVERVTWTFDPQPVVRSRLPERGGEPRVVMTDLTVDAPGR